MLYVCEDRTVCRTVIEGMDWVFETTGGEFVVARVCLKEAEGRWRTDT